MENQQTPTPQPGNGESKPRKRRARDPHAPGEPLGEIINELSKLTSLARVLEHALSGGYDDDASKQATAEHLGDRLDDVTSRLATIDLDVRPARRGDS